MTNAHATALAALLLRLSLGALFLAHGLLKAFVFTLPGTVQFFASLGYPAALAYVVVAAEIGGGLLLLLGLFTRPVSLAFIPILAGALLVHLPNGWLFSSAKGGWEFPALWIILLLVQALLGPGAFAVRLSRDANETFKTASA
ncbi:DoxX family protein [Methylocystis parvus]|uniref:DoxX family protein n=1 Tax=Methylocystis parvus TaxID=134 RepID=A0A6B8M9Z5_9HYPH|nr:DoxX family protein [Methylocystis parvus]QGM97480.1 DoxX family protein [Methylocystis parvus]WBK02079.1 DoxX family protein [Methylocystis parvus OBBP]